MTKHRKALTKTQSEPALVRGAVVAVLALLASAGVGWATSVDATLVTGVVVAVIALAQAVWTKFAVTANAKVLTRVTTDGRVVAGDAAVAPTGALVPVQGGGGSTPVTGSVPVRPELVTPDA